AGRCFSSARPGHGPYNRWRARTQSPLAGGRIVSDRSRYCFLARVVWAAGLLSVSLAASALAAAPCDTLIAPTGKAAEDHFGFTAGSAGDVNGDGYADVIVG